MGSEYKYNCAFFGGCNKSINDNTFSNYIVLGYFAFSTDVIVLNIIN